jgi:site-specific DNA recombinase
VSSPTKPSRTARGLRRSARIRARATGPRWFLRRLVARAWATAKREAGDEITEREVTALLADFARVWSERFPAEQARIVQLLIERVDVQENALEIRIRAEGLASLVGELQQESERKAA